MFVSEALRTRSAMGAVALLVAGLLAACGGGVEGGAPEKCGPTTKFETLKSGVLKAAVIEFPPYASMPPGAKQPTGVDGEVLVDFAKASCLKLEAVGVDFPSAVTSITSKRADVTAGDLFRTQERSETVGLTDPVYLDQLGIVSKSGLESVEDLKSKDARVGIVQGIYAQAEIEELFGDKVSLFPNSVNLFQAIFAGRIDAAIESYIPAKLYLKKQGKDDYSVAVPPADPRLAATGDESAQTAHAFDKDNQKLGDALNAHLKVMRESGKLADLCEKYGLPRSAAETGPARFM